jgi:hypothetical protein
MALTYDKNKVTWKYNKEYHEYCVDNIFDAEMKKKYIFINSFIKNETFEVFTYLTLTGIFIASATYKYTDGYNVSVKILDENNKEALMVDSNIIDVNTNGTSLFVIEDTYKKIIQYSLHGKRLREYPILENYTIGSFFDLPESDKEIKIICHGPEDKYGKDTYCLSLNLETGEWTVLYSMLDK